MPEQLKLRGFQDDWRSLFEVRRFSDGRVQLDPRLRATLRGLASRTPEAVFSKTGSAHTARQLRLHLNYISRGGELAIKGRDGELIAGREEVRELTRDWIADDVRWRSDAPLARYFVASYPDHRDPAAVERAGRQLASSLFASNNDFITAFHTDTDHPHLHITVRSFGEDGAQLDLRLPQLKRWREVWAEKLRNNGLETIATPRWVRGIFETQRRSMAEHVHAKDQDPEQRQPSRREARILDDARRAYEDGQTHSPWDDLVRHKRHEAVMGYRQVAHALMDSPDREDMELGYALSVRVQRIGEALTRKSRLIERFREEDREIERKLQRERRRELGIERTIPR